jgi:hypothetical protein
VSGTKKILETALEQLIEREDVLGKSMVELRRQLEAAEREAKEVHAAIREQRAAIDRMGKVRGSGGRRTPSARPWARREPADGTQAKTVLDVIRSWDAETISLGVVVQRSGLPAGKVRSILGELVKREYIERESEGIYKLVIRDPA